MTNTVNNVQECYYSYYMFVTKSNLFVTDFVINAQFSIQIMLFKSVSCLTSQEINQGFLKLLTNFCCTIKIKIICFAM